MKIGKDSPADFGKQKIFSLVLLKPPCKCICPHRLNVRVIQLSGAYRSFDPKIGCKPA